MMDKVHLNYFLIRDFKKFPEVKTNNADKLADKIVNMLCYKFDHWNWSYVNWLSDKGKEQQTRCLTPVFQKICLMQEKSRSALPRFL